MCVCVGGIGRVSCRPLAEQLWERAVEELMTGPAGQKPSAVSEHTAEFRERSAGLVAQARPGSRVQHSGKIKTQAVDVMTPSGVVLLFVFPGGQQGSLVPCYLSLILSYISSDSLKQSFAAN